MSFNQLVKINKLPRTVKIELGLDPPKVYLESVDRYRSSISSSISKLREPEKAAPISSFSSYSQKKRSGRNSRKAYESAIRKAQKNIEKISHLESMLLSLNLSPSTFVELSKDEISRINLIISPKQDAIEDESGQMAEAA